MPEADYLLAALPDRFIILGQLLRPFSLGHLMILKRLNNAFVSGAEKITLADTDDLISGVLVCSNTYEEANETLQDPKLPGLLNQWGEKLGEFDILQKMREFSDYVTKGCTRPLLALPDEDGTTPGAPFIQRLKIVLQSELNQSESEVLNKPFGLALHDYFAFFEIKKAVRILTQEDIETSSTLEQLAKEMEKDLKKMVKKAKADAKRKAAS